jgi:hypothetical protein
MTRPIVLVAVLPLLAACGTRPLRGEAGAPRAVVLSTAAADAESDRIARALNDHGFDVVRKSTTIVRERSSAAVYAVRDNPDRVDDVTKILHDELGLPIDVLPFQQHATGGNAVVVWLGTEGN